MANILLFYVRCLFGDI
uniref:Uncharacterized protein n=1 Tax=Anguilla anguilla TaxID=7936 RepID=A0A0E9V6M4_ANGAN